MKDAAPLLVIIGLAGAAVLAGCVYYTVDTVRMLKRGHQVQKEMNRDGR